MEKTKHLYIIKNIEKLDLVTGLPGKTPEEVINQILITWKSVGSVKHQHGFLNSKSCQTHLILFCESITGHRDKEK